MNDLSTLPLVSVPAPVSSHRFSLEIICLLRLSYLRRLLLASLASLARAAGPVPPVAPSPLPFLKLLLLLVCRRETSARDIPSGFVVSVVQSSAILLTPVFLHLDASAVEFCPVDFPSVVCVVFPSENGIVWISLHVRIRPSSFTIGRADASTYVSSWPVSTSVWVY